MRRARHAVKDAIKKYIMFKKYSRLSDYINLILHLTDGWSCVYEIGGLTITPTSYSTK